MTTAVLAMAYGTPADHDDIAAFYTDVRRGRPPSPEQLEELVSRYDAIGGTSPFAARTAEQLVVLQAALDDRAPGRYRTYYGAKHAEPKIEAAVNAAVLDGCTELVGFVLAPHYSALSVGEYVERAAEAAAAAGLPASFLASWHDEPALIAALALRVRAAIGQLSEEESARVVVAFSAHSLPARVLELGDPYPAELATTAGAVAGACSLTNWSVAWQSAARTHEPWLGPDILEVIDGLAREGATAVVVCPAGFTSDHLEILYDLDVVAAARAASLGMGFSRTASLNADREVFAALAGRLITLVPESADRPG